MSDTPGTDAVDLIRGPERPDAWFRCGKCAVRQLREQALPTGGLVCTECDARLGQQDLIDVVGPQVRLVAFLLDLFFLAAPYFVIGFGILVADPWIAKDDTTGQPTDGARLVLRALAIAGTLVYLYALEAIGQTPGKLVLGIKAVKVSTWARPGAMHGGIRLVVKMLSIAMLGLPFLLMLRDPLRRPAHGRIAGTIVVHR